MSEIDGGILNLYCELPHGLRASEIGSALLGIDLEVTGMREPPVARVRSVFGANSDETLTNEIADYRRFYVEFEPGATANDVITATGIVYAALQRLAS